MWSDILNTQDPQRVSGLRQLGVTLHSVHKDTAQEMEQADGER